MNSRKLRDTFSRLLKHRDKLVKDHRIARAENVSRALNHLGEELLAIESSERAGK